MNTQYTPGPWTTRRGTDLSGDIAICCGDEVAILAECFSSIRRAGERAYEECTANALLIAAAPELLEALQQMVEIAELTIGWLATPDGADGPLIVARAAIAKAIGSEA